MAIKGTLKTMSLTDLLQFLAAGRKSGTLKFDHGKITKQVYFKNGVIVGSKSNDPKEYLGQVLLHYGKVDENQLQIAREAQRSSRTRLGEVLVEQGFLTEDEVLAVLKTRTLEMIYDLFVWTEGDFEFYDDDALPADLILIEVDPTKVIMEGIYRIDEFSRYRSLVTSDRAVLALGPGSASATKLTNELQQIIFFVERRMSVAEICYNMHTSSFHVYGQLYELISKGIAHVTGELPEPSGSSVVDLDEFPLSIDEMISSAHRSLDEDPEGAIELLQRVLQEEPNSIAAQNLLTTAEERFIQRVYASEMAAEAVPILLVSPDDLTNQHLGPQEGFVLSRINGSWDVQSILSICPFRDVDCLRMIRKLLQRGIIGF